MNEALIQKTQITNTSSSYKEEKNRAIMLASVDTRQTLNNTSSTEQLIQKHKITVESDVEEVAEILAKESINQILSEFINSGKIKKVNGKYQYGITDYTYEQIEDIILNSCKTRIQSMVDRKFENIKLELQKQGNNVKRQSNNKKIQDAKNNIDRLKPQLKEAEELQAKKTDQYLAALSRQNDAVSKAREENARLKFNAEQLKFNQDTLSAKAKELMLAQKNRVSQLEQNRRSVDEAKRRRDEHIDNLEARYQEALARQNAHEENMRLQEDIANRSAQNIRDQIAAANANNVALMDANARNTAAIVGSQVQGDSAILDGLQQLGASLGGIQNDFDAMNKQLKDLNTNMTNIGKTIKNPPPGMPPGCIGSSLPRDCQGNRWVMVPRFKQAINRSTGQTDIEIYQCNIGGHFCSSDGNQGTWDIDLPFKYSNISGFERYSQRGY